MKKLFFVLIASLIFWSCDQADETAVPEVSVPAEIAQTIAKLFNGNESNLRITTIKPNELFAASLMANQVKYQLIIDGQGNVKKLATAISPDSLLKPIQDYLDKSYPNATIQDVFKIQNGLEQPVTEYGVTIDVGMESSSVQMFFDTLGGLNSTVDIEVQVFEGLAVNLENFTDLPQSIQLFLSKQHPGLEFLFASFLSPDNGSAWYDVAIKVDDKQYIYEFTSTGQLIEVYELDDDFTTGPIITSGSFSIINDSSDLPAKIIDYLNANFSGWQFLSGNQELDDASQVLNYTLNIKIGSTVYYVFFDADAVFLGAKKAK